MSFRYSELCGTAFDAVDAVKLEIPLGFYIFENQNGTIPYIVVVKKRSVIRTFFSTTTYTALPYFGIYY
jgi:hypothetical protein